MDASKPRCKPRAPPSPKDLRRRPHTGRQDHRGSRRRYALFPTKGHFASYAGTAPLEASSGEAVRHHRLSLAGNHHLNYALHMVAVCQARSDVRGGAYYRKKLAEGKSRKEALRCLKRRISDAVFRSLMVDSKAPSSSAA
jgi:transposase